MQRRTPYTSFTCHFSLQPLLRQEGQPAVVVGFKQALTCVFSSEKFWTKVAGTHTPTEASAIKSTLFHNQGQILVEQTWDKTLHSHGGAAQPFEIAPFRTAGLLLALWGIEYLPGKMEGGGAGTHHVHHGFLYM